MLVKEEEERHKH